MNLPTVKQLRYFVALEHLEHFGKAAEACFVSQSAFSTAIRELETVLQVQLVDRTNKNVTVTHVGRQIAAEARRCLRDLENLVEIARSNQAPLTGDLRVWVLFPRLRHFYCRKLCRNYASNFHGCEFI